MQNHASTLAAEFKLDAARVAATVALIDEGNTIPFIARRPCTIPLPSRAR